MTGRRGEYPNGWPWLWAVMIYLSVKLIYRLTVTASEYARTSTVWIDIAFTAFAMWASIHFVRQIRAHPDTDRQSLPLANWLCGIAITAGVGVLLLRLVPEHGWKTGHWSYDWRK
ncbi:MAG: hypothetical protein WBB25_01030 [Sulfitobacter sp.]